MFIFSDPVRAALVIGLLVAIIIVLLLVIWSIKRHRSPHLHIESDQPIEKLVGSLAACASARPSQATASKFSRTARCSTS